MAEMSYGEIVNMIVRSFNNLFNNGIGDEKKTLMECATKIYIAQMNKRTPKEREGERKWTKKEEFAKIVVVLFL